jgi:hypothetical protein
VDLRDSRGHRADDISANFPGTGPMRPDEFCAPLCVEGYLEKGWAAAGFHFGFQSKITQRHLPAPTVRPKSHKFFYWMLLGDAGCKLRRIENPRVGGSIPPLATIQIMSYRLRASRYRRCTRGVSTFYAATQYDPGGRRNADAISTIDGHRTCLGAARVGDGSRYPH